MQRHGHVVSRCEDRGGSWAEATAARAARDLLLCRGEERGGTVGLGPIDLRAVLQQQVDDLRMAPEAGSVQRGCARLDRSVYISSTVDQVLGDLGMPALPSHSGASEAGCERSHGTEAVCGPTCALAKRMVEPTFGLEIASLYFPFTTCFFTSSRFPARTAWRNSFGARSPPIL